VPAKAGTWKPVRIRGATISTEFVGAIKRATRWPLVLWRRETIPISIFISIKLQRRLP